MTVEYGTIVVRRGTTSQWAASDRVLMAGEHGLDTTTGELKMGNGVDLWADLDVILGEASAAAAIATPESAISVALKAALVPRPDGGTDGQVLVHSGGDVEWGEPPASGAPIDQWRAEYFGRAFNPPPVADIPVITITQTTTPTIASGVLIREKRISDNSSLGADLAGDTHFRYDGSASFPPVAASASFYVQSVLVPGGASQSAYYTGRYETVTDPANFEIEIKIRPPASSIVFRLTVNGRPVTADAIRMTGLSAGAGHLLKLVFPIAAARHIVFEPFGTTGFGGMAVASTQTLTRPFTPVQLRQAYIGDSFLGGTGSPPTGAGRLETFGRLHAQLCGADSIYNLGVGGTGWTTANPFSDRVADALAVAPHEVYILGSRNDGNVDVQAQAAAVLTALAAVPSVYLIGPAEPSPTAYATQVASLQAAASAAGRPFIDGRGWLADTARYIQGDNIHPTFAGQKRIAAGIYEGRLAANAI